MSQKNKNLSCIVSALMDFLHDDILLNKLSNTPLKNKICFDCTLWNKGIIYDDNSANSQIKILPIKNHFLRLLCSVENFIREQLSNSNYKNYDYKSQLDRFLSILIDLKNKVSSITCSNTCNDIKIISMLLTTTIQTILSLVTTLENINTLLSTYTENYSCICINSNTFSIFMGLFINSITQFQSLLQDWYIISITFFNLSSYVPKTYVASYIPKNYIIQPKPIKPINHFCPPCTPNNIDCDNINKFRPNY